MSVDGLVTWPSPLTASQTLDQLKAAIDAAGLTVFAHVDHAAAAQIVGLSLPALDLVIFGNPRAGTPLMAAVPTLGIDLPLKALVWQDAAGKAWLSFNSPAWFAVRHQLPPGFGKALDAMSTQQASLANRAVANPEGV
jgi:uncharacterized protein (DUF302 family)